MRSFLSQRNRETLRHVVLEIAIVTVGIVIALGLDGLVEKRREDELGRIAKAQIEREIANNKAEIDQLFGDYEKARKNLRQVLETLDEAASGLERAQTRANAGQRDVVTPRLQYEIKFEFVGLSTSAFTTAQATGALRHMDLADARRYAEVYGLQEMFRRNHDRLYDHFVTALPGPGGALRRGDLEARRHALVTMWQYMNLVEQLAQALAKEYARKS